MSKVLQNAPREHSAILSTFIKLPFVFKTFVLSIFEWPLKTGFTVFGLKLKIMLMILLMIQVLTFSDVQGGGGVHLLTKILNIHHLHCGWQSF